MKTVAFRGVKDDEVLHRPVTAFPNCQRVNAPEVFFNDLAFESFDKTNYENNFLLTN